jgi:formylglycine-generating enzyme
LKNKLFSIIILTLLASVSNADNALYKDPVTGIELILVKGGCFEMGDVPRGRDTDRGPAHNVCVSNFYMGKYEVTQKQWVTVMGNNPSFFKTGDNYPVEHISFVDAQVFLNRLKELTGKPYRLPTEAEWEYAARGGGKRAQYAGAINDHDIDKYVWYKPNAGHKTHPVGKKMPNELGLYDMSGNVWEYVSDWYDPDYYRVSPRDNPRGPDKGSQRVLRGGSWFSDKGYVHVANRGRAGEVARYSGICGFRLVLPAQ